MASKRPLNAAISWVKRQPPKVKAFMAVVAGMATLVFIRFIVHDHDNLFVAAEAAHAIGILVLIYKLTKEKTCAGSVLQSLSFFNSLYFGLICNSCWVLDNCSSVLCLILCARAVLVDLMDSPIVKSFSTAIEWSIAVGCSEISAKIWVFFCRIL